MTFNELIDLMGRRSDSSEVAQFATENGIKLPLKSTSNSYDSKEFFLKKLDLEVRWSHEVMLEGFFPPQKENKKYVSYICGIWFDHKKIAQLPSNWLATDTFEQMKVKLQHLSFETVLSEEPDWFTFALPSHPNCKISVLEGRRSVILLKESYRYKWLKSDTRSSVFCPWKKHWPKEQADLPTGMFMAWCIQNEWVGKRHLDKNLELVRAVQRCQLTGREFLYLTAYRSEFWSHDIAPKVARFAYIYMYSKCLRNSSQPLLGKEGRCTVNEDFMAVFDPLFSAGGLQAADVWENYNRFALFLDARWYDYQKTGLQTDVQDVAVLADVKAFYCAQQLKMQALPFPVELATS